MKALHSKKRSYWTWGVVFLCISFLLWNPLHITQHVKGFVHNMFAPLVIQARQVGVGVANITGFFGNLQNMRETYEKSESDLFALAARTATLEHVALENEELRRIVDLPIVTQEDVTAADVIMRDFSGDGWILLNRGTRDDIRVDDLVITADNILIGRIFEVTSTSSYVRLSTQEESVFHVVKAGTVHTAVARGAHGIAITVDHIASDADIKPGDVFLLYNTKNAEADARHVSLGTVQDVITADDRLSQSARLVPLYDVNALTHVFILHTRE